MIVNPWRRLREAEKDVEFWHREFSKRIADPPRVVFPVGTTILPGPLTLHGDVAVWGLRDEA